MRNVVIAGYLRTACSKVKFSEPGKDWFSTLRADDLLAEVIPALLQRSGTEGAEVDDLIVGSALGVSEQWTCGGRTAVFLANLPAQVPARFIDQQCGSGMAAIHTGFLEIAAGYADVVLAAGMEHMGRVPIGPTLFEKGALSVNPRLYREERFRHWDMETTMHMGFTAEKLCAVSGFSREDLDLWGARSHQRAAKAQLEGFFDGEILPVEARQDHGEVMSVARDQGIRENVKPEDMAKLAPVFRPDGLITAGNASPLNAGAGALLLMSGATAKSKELEPLATIRSIGFAGVDPTLMGTGPVPAARMALKKAGLEPADIDYWEINEAFSIVVLNAIRELGIDPERVNVNGGAIAIGHPLGATGIRLVGTLARILKASGARFGCAAACIGGGQGIATIIERTG
ncbi:MAG: acetyl-CoA C-acetyltransferase [bacterium]|nr:acetyl-CoA C-acetyltransferase [bacterium]